MAGFELRGHMLGAQNPITYNIIIKNSQALVKGNSILMSGGFCTPATAGSLVFGIVVGIVDKNDIDLDNTASDNYDGTWVSSTGTYTASSDNQTDKMVKAKIVADPFAIWYNDADANLTAAMEFQHFNLISKSQIDGDTNTESYGQFQLLKRDPDGDADASKGLFRISEWQGFPYVQQ